MDEILELCGDGKYRLPINLTFWTKGAHKLSFSGILPSSVDADANDPICAESVIYATAEGVGTERAFKEFVCEVTLVLRTLMSHYSLSTKFWHLSALCAATSREELVSDSKLPFASVLSELSHLLDAYFNDPGKKDSLARRVRNAIHLLVQADQQPSHAIGLALSVAAMESMLCRNDENLANMLAENVTTLLEPNPRYRAAAVRFVKQLYSLRSEVLHGARSECDYSDFRNARDLAGAVIRAFVERRMARQRAGYEDEKPDQLIAEMRDDKYTPGQLTWVSRSTVAMLWRSMEAGTNG